jgi:hypothetical protein
MRDPREREQELSPRLRAAIHVLKQSSSPDAVWRAELLRRIDDSSVEVIPIATRPPARRWSMRPTMAIAAGVMCALIGAGSTAALLLLRQSSETRVAAETGVLPVRFRLVAPEAGRVSLVGDFNRWDPVALPLRRSTDGRTWEVEVQLRPGRYSYSFVVDGRLARDPAAPQEAGDDYGSPNSVLLLRGS